MDILYLCLSVCPAHCLSFELQKHTEVGTKYSRNSIPQSRSLSVLCQTMLQASSMWVAVNHTSGAFWNISLPYFSQRTGAEDNATVFNGECKAFQ